MKDPRVEGLARIMVNYSASVSEGDTCVVEGELLEENGVFVV